MFKFTVLISDLWKWSKYCDFTFSFYTIEVLELFTNLLYSVILGVQSTIDSCGDCIVENTMPLSSDESRLRDYKLQKVSKLVMMSYQKHQIWQEICWPKLWTNN